MLLRKTELENKVMNLRQVVKQLEAYRDRYVDLYELTPVGYVTLDDEGYVQEINLAGTELLGKDREGIIGYPMESHVAAADKAEFLRQVQRCCSENQVLTMDVGLTTGTGQSITAHLRGVPIESLNTKTTFCKIAVADITERKRTEEAIRASEANYRAIFDTANDAIFVHDAETGAILDTNQKATEMYGYSAEEFMADPALLEKIVHPGDHQRLMEHLGSKARTPEPYVDEYRVISRTGEERWIEHICQPVFGVDHVWLGRRASNRDITDRKKAELQLKEIIEVLERSLSNRPHKP